MALALARARVLIVSKRDNVADNALATINGRLSIQRRELERESGSGSTDGGEDLNIEGLSGGQGNVEYLKADLADLADTLRVAKEIEQKTDKLDFFISDASVNAIKTVPDSTVDSVQLDAQITANVISTFVSLAARLHLIPAPALERMRSESSAEPLSVHLQLLTNRLLPLMRNAAKVQASEGGQASGPGPNTGTSLGVRFVNISSELHRLAPPNSTRFESLQEFSTSVPAAEQHARAKLANILFTRQLANNVLLPNGDRIRALAVHPGAPPSSDPSITANGSADAAEAGGAGVSNDSGPKGTVSSAASGPGPIKSALNALMKPFTRDASPAGAATPLWAATSNLVDEHNLQGAYLSSPDAGQAGKESDLAKDDRVAENLWQMCEYVVKSRVGQDALRDWNAK